MSNDIVTNPEGQLPVSWQDELAAAAVEGAKEEVVSGAKRITIQGGRFSYRDHLHEGALKVVVLDSVYENVYYTTAYDPDNIAPPECFALHHSFEKMVPDKKAHDAQSSDCASCLHNAFGSADNGRGKACGNRRRLMVINAEDLSVLTSGAPVEPAMLSLPATSLQSWAKYVKLLAGDATKRPPWAVVTELALEPVKTYAIVRPTCVSLIDDGAVLARIKELRASVQDDLMKGYDYAPPQEKKQSGTKRAPVGAVRKAKF